MCPYRRKVGIRLRKARCHLVSEASMLFDDIPMARNVVSVSSVFPPYTFISLIINLLSLYLLSLQAL